MGGCPSRPTDLSALGLCSTKAGLEGLEATEIYAPERINSRSSTCARADNASPSRRCLHEFAMDVQESEDVAGQPRVETLMQTRQARQVVSTPRQSRPLEEPEKEPRRAESPVRMALNHNKDFARDFRGLPPEKVRTRIAMIIRDWEAKLKIGTLVLMSGKRSAVAYDQALQCLDLRDQGALYPLAALCECAHLPRKAGRPLELFALFHDTESLVFEFERAHDRAGFALTLQALAAEARKDKWHEDAVCEGDSDEESECGEMGWEARSTDTGGATPDEAEEVVKTMVSA
mmetsp:Transcript_82972/g.216220  ORF Transcript_82972/g.216220 Transcript_82972/m.216220 type:complete len:289 (-) Transcript_82972:103-969(-)